MQSSGEKIKLLTYSKFLLDIRNDDGDIFIFLDKRQKHALYYYNSHHHDFIQTYNNILIYDNKKHTYYIFSTFLINIIENGFKLLSDFNDKEYENIYINENNIEISWKSVVDYEFIKSSITSDINVTFESKNKIIVPLTNFNIININDLSSKIIKSLDSNYTFKLYTCNYSSNKRYITTTISYNGDKYKQDIDIGYEKFSNHTYINFKNPIIVSEKYKFTIKLNDLSYSFAFVDCSYDEIKPYDNEIFIVYGCVFNNNDILLLENNFNKMYYQSYFKYVNNECLNILDLPISVLNIILNYLSTSGLCRSALDIKTLLNYRITNKKCKDIFDKCNLTIIYDQPEKIINNYFENENKKHIDPIYFSNLNKIYNGDMNRKPKFYYNFNMLNLYYTGMNNIYKLISNMIYIKKIMIESDNFFDSILNSDAKNYIEIVDCLFLSNELCDFLTKLPSLDSIIFDLKWNGISSYLCILKYFNEHNLLNKVISINTATIHINDMDILLYLLDNCNVDKLEEIKINLDFDIVNDMIIELSYRLYKFNKLKSIEIYSNDYIELNIFDNMMNLKILRINLTIFDKILKTNKQLKSVEELYISSDDPIKSNISVFNIYYNFPNVKILYIDNQIFPRIHLLDTIDNN